MSKPSAGNYYIVNRETTSDGTLLAITFNGADAILTVTELGSQPTQVWVISDNDAETQAISPQDTGTSYQVGFKGEDKLTVIPADGIFWHISGTDGIYTIRNKSLFPWARVFWGLRRAEVGQVVHTSAADDNVKQSWKLIPA